MFQTNRFWHDQHMETISKQQKRDLRIIAIFLGEYCNGKHDGCDREPHSTDVKSEKILLCSECSRLLEYAISKRLKCPLQENKPSCKNCRIHCYESRERGQMREVMAYAGKRFICKGRLDYLWHYFF